jgi:hypothetical protein
LHLFGGHAPAILFAALAGTQGGLDASGFAVSVRSTGERAGTAGGRRRRLGLRSKMSPILRIGAFILFASFCLACRLRPVSLHRALV